MGKYYYVCMKNRLQFCDDQNKYHETVTSEETSKFAGNLSLGCYEPNALAIKNVKYEVRTRTVQARYGLRNENYSSCFPFFMICEDKTDFLEDVITGKEYIKKNSKGPYYYDFVDSDKLILSIAKEIPVSKVVELLKSLNKDDITRYKVGSDNLDIAIAYGYKMDQIRIKNEKKQTQDNESFIKNVKNNYGK